ncbi:hypothetical protein [Pyrobaculum aerophilum]|uniref:hypothetical protein n=1 Tax=Pyrobaculum aerophilum TaxID=13773 RepID=UPI0023EFAF41|nr:hypothetical protein [Pyrobaculum aerophilum]MCX8137673.1 hypothetical protein [Pyrobaculum aerophilum]
MEMAEKGLAEEEPDLRDTPVVEYRLIEEGMSLDVLDDLAMLTESGVPTFDKAIRKIVRIKKGYNEGNRLPCVNL